jgi:Zn-dependent M28 family amino/carboxypeptidase
MTRVAVLLIILILSTCCCNLPGLQSILGGTSPTPQPAVTAEQLFPTQGSSFTPIPIPTREIPSNRVEQVESMLALTSLESWEKTVREFSGAVPFTLDGRQYTITTRLSEELFSGSDPAPAFDYLLMRAEELVPEEWIEVQEYTYRDKDGTRQWANIVVTIPGKTLPDEEVLLTAHIDSATYDFDPEAPAPGADDNASGVAALLEALAVFNQYEFERTVKIVFFSGEEYGLWGSRAYTRQNDMDAVQAVINLDVISYDPNNDQCADLHAGTLAQSENIGLLMQQLVETYSLDLQLEYFTDDAIDASDHSPFWEEGVGAVLLSANLIDGRENTCEPAEFNPKMHTADDTFRNINAYTGFELTRLALITAIELAGPLP